MNLRRRIPEEPDLLIDIAPLIDVVFILLIFFMVSTTFDHHAGLEIQLPQASVDSSNTPTQKIEIAIDAKGHYFINGSALINEQLDTLKRALEKLRMESHVAGQPQLPVILQADAQTPHQSVVRAMDAARQAGLTRLNFATSQPQ